MMLLKACALPILLLMGSTISSSAQSVNSFVNSTGVFLSTHVKNGKVAYRHIKQQPAPLNNLVQTIENISLDDASATQKEAFYINAYNMLVIHSIIAHGIPSSPQKIDGFFDTIKHPIAGQQLTLDEIENKHLRAVYNDPRIHFSIVCGAVSCPPIRPFAYQPERLDEQLTKVTRTTLNSDFLKVNASQKTVHISEIFKWYKQDFLDSSDSIVAFINQYRKEAIPDDYTVDYYDYDWSLNSM